MQTQVHKQMPTLPFDNSSPKLSNRGLKGSVC